jgi:drug/metabolite transporter (DMT)-like permease
MSSSLAISSANGLDRTNKAVTVILIAVFAMSLQAMAMKYVSATLTIWQITIFRSIIILSALLPLLVAGRKRAALRFEVTGWLAVRSILMAVMNLFYYGSLPLMDISVAATGFYTAPTLITLMAAIFAGDRLNSINAIAVALGFVGVFLVVKPGQGGFGWMIVLPILSAFTYGCAALITRLKCQESPPLTMAVMVHGCFLILGLCAQIILALFWKELRSVTDYQFVVGDWTPMTPQIWGVMLVLASLNATTHWGFAKAYQIGRPTVVATWEYSYLLFVTVLGAVIFHEMPDSWTIAGMTVITVSGMLNLSSEWIRKVLR